MPQSRPVPLPDGSTLTLLQPAAGGQPADWAADLALGPVGAVVLVAGGDDPLDEARRPRLMQLVARGLVRTLRELAGQQGGGARALCLVRASGSGLPALLGRAVADSGGALKLLGVAPAAVLALPGDASGAAGDAPVVGLSHLLATSGAAWGDELAAKFGLAQALVAQTPAAAAAGSPTRPAVRPLLLVIGGGPAAQVEALLAVRCGWPVLLVEGSGGVADALARQMAQGEADGDDPAVAEILADGRVSTITMGGKVANAVEALASWLQRECGGESVLRLAWQRFSALDAAATAQQRDHGTVQSWILVLGVMAVAMTALQQQAQINGWAAWANALQLALIVLPIVLSVFIAFGKQFSPGTRWVLLRTAAEAIKREIYLYRVRPHRSPADNSREKRLQQAMEQINLGLVGTEIKSMGIPPYFGPIPPLYSVAPDDDGMSVLDTSRYVKLRLGDQLSYYGYKATYLSHVSRRWQLLAMVLGALGSLLAALGGELIAWVALTSAMATASVTYLRDRNIDSTLSNYNLAFTDLQNLLAWWTALRPDEQADPHQIDSLVTATERIMAGERGGWGESMKPQAEALPAPSDELAEARPEPAAVPSDATPVTLPATEPAPTPPDGLAPGKPAGAAEMLAEDPASRPGGGP